MQINIEPGSLIHWNGKKLGAGSGIVIDQLDLANLVVRSAATLSKLVVPIADIIADPDIKTVIPELYRVSNDLVSRAESEFAILKPLLLYPKNAVPMEDIKKAAGRLGCHPSTVYGKVNKLRKDPRLTTLLRKPRDDAGKARLKPEQEEALQGILPKYTHIQKLSYKSVHKELKTKCEELGIKLPHYNTLRARIMEIPAPAIDEGRHGKDYARQKHGRNRGKIPNAEFPLAIVQVDHTPIDLLLVHEQYGTSVKRAYLTLAICVYTRMVLGFYISLNPVGLFSTAKCLTQAILRKEKYLERLGVPGEWPCYGMIHILHTDNAKEFHSLGLKFASKQRGFDLVKRPKTRPNFGGRIESGFRTFMQETHTLPGTTNSNVHKNNKYKSEEHAALTIDDYERWFADYIINDYHLTVHEAIDVPPISLWRDSILGDETTPGIGLPPIIVDEHRLYLDFLPMVERQITVNGVTFQNIRYWSDIFNTMINLIDPENPTQSKEYIFRYESDDLSRLWFWDEVSKTYFDIPTYDKTAPAMTIWDIKKTSKAIKATGRKLTNEREIIEGRRRRLNLVEQSAATSKKLRREDQMNIQNSKSAINKTYKPLTQSTLHVVPVEDIEILPEEDIDE